MICIDQLINFLSLIYCHIAVFAISTAIPHKKSQWLIYSICMMILIIGFFIRFHILAIFVIKANNPVIVFIYQDELNNDNQVQVNWNYQIGLIKY